MSWCFYASKLIVSFNCIFRANVYTNILNKSLEPVQILNQNLSCIVLTGLRLMHSSGLISQHTLSIAVFICMQLLQTHQPGTSLSGEGCGGGPISWFLLLVSISLTSRTTDGVMELISFNSSFASSPESWSISSYQREIITDKFKIRTNIEEFKNDNREKHILFHVNLLTVAFWLHSKWSCWRFSSSLSSSCLAWNTRLPLLVPRPLPWPRPLPLPLPLPTDVEGGESDSVVTWSINMYNLVNSWK